MGALKITSWNIEWLNRVLGNAQNQAQPTAQADAQAKLANIAREISEIAPDVLCVIEGPNSEAKIDRFAQHHLGGAYVAVKAPNNDYRQRGQQWIWFLVRQALAQQTNATLLPLSVWETYTTDEDREHTGKTWPVHFWGGMEKKRHRHYRHPQVLVLDWHGQRIEMIGLHLKSKFVKIGRWNGTAAQKQAFTEEAIKARIKLATEAANVRDYIKARFRQEENPCIFVMGDLNDGPGKELFERQFLFFDLIANIQGDVFFARRFVNHALFDYSDQLRWSVFFKDKVDPKRDPHILLDHILFTQALVRQQHKLWVEPHAGLVEHEIHDRINAQLSTKHHTSDHKPLSCLVTTAP